MQNGGKNYDPDSHCKMKVPHHRESSVATDSPMHLTATLQTPIRLSRRCTAPQSQGNKATVHNAICEDVFTLHV
jgi:hypothetical protein